jgi:hypothetical protein
MISRLIWFGVIPSFKAKVKGADAAILEKKRGLILAPILHR